MNKALYILINNLTCAVRILLLIGLLTLLSFSVALAAPKDKTAEVANTPSSMTTVVEALPSTEALKVLETTESTLIEETKNPKEKKVKLTKEQSAQIKDLQKQVKAGEITQEEFDKLYAEIVKPAVEEPEAEALSARTAAATVEEAAAQSIGKFVAPQVSESNGSLNYNFPIALPEGRNSLTPQLNLNYNSSNKSHAYQVAKGWSFDTPYIQRLNKKGVNNLYTENYFTSSLDGELIDQGNNIYVPKVENGTFLKYEFVSGTHWKITAKDGTVYMFGQTAGTRQDDPVDTSRIYAWMLETVTDTNGNTITYTYHKNEGQIYPLTISYNQEGLYEVNFKRTARATANTSYASGFKVITNDYISSVDVKTDGAISSTYDVNKDSEGFLTDIEITGIDGTTNITLPKTDFEYNNSNIVGFNEDTSFNLPTNSSNKVVLMADGTSATIGAFYGDVNGDGLSDSIIWRSGLPNLHSGNKVFLNGSAGFVEDPNFLLPTDPAGNVIKMRFNSSTKNGYFFADMNGDGLSDIVTWTMNQYNGNPNGYKNGVYLNTGTTWVRDVDFWLPSTNLDSPYGKILDLRQEAGMFFGDINGDGLPDFAPNWPGNHAFINTGSTYVKDTSFKLPKKSNGSQVNLGTDYNNYDYGVIFQDINADGLSDFLKWDSRYNHAHANNMLYLNNGDGTFSEDSTFLLPLWYGKVQALAVEPGYQYGVFFRDINADGLPDIVRWRAGNNNNYYENTAHINNGDGTFSEDTTFNLPTYSNGNVRYLGNIGTLGAFFDDVNGNGYPDFLMWRYNTTNSATENTLFENNISGWSLNEIENSTSGTTSFEYDFARMQDDSNHVHFPLEVVSKVTTDDNNGNVDSTDYEYFGADFWYNTAFDKKFTGFESIKKTDPAGNVSTSYFHQNNGESSNEPTDTYGKIGRVYKTEVKDASGDLFTRSVTLFDENSIGTDVVSVLPESVLTQQYDGTSSHIDTAVGYEYDSYGNRLKEILYGLVSGSVNGTFSDSGSDRRDLEKIYTNDTVNYIVGLPTSQILKDNSGTKQSESTFSYDANGNMTGISEWISGSDYRSKTLGYNTLGLLTSETDYLNNTTTYSYDSHNMYPANISNALSQVTTVSYDYSSGKPTLTTEPNGKQTQYVYDALDRLVEVKNTAGNTLETTSTISYNTTASPQYKKTTLHRSASDTQDSYGYVDGFARAIQTKSETDSGWATVDTIYNELGQVEKTSLPYETSSSANSNATSNSSFLSRFTYDTLGRTTEVSNAKGDTTTNYDGLETTITDAENNDKDLIKDAFGNLVTVKEHEGSSVYTTDYDYNTLGLLTKITDAEGNVRNLSYDALGRRTALEDLHSSSDSTFGTWSFSYNDQNLTSETDPNGSVTSYAYDLLNRILTENNSSTAGVDVTNTYDSCTNGVGLLCSVTTPDVATTYSYLADANVSSETKTIDSTAYTTSYSYDRAGNTLSATHPNASVTTSTYNTQGLVDEVKQDGVSVATFTYGVHGKPTTESRANGATTSYSYDANNLYEMINKTTTLNAADIQDLSYLYDNVGNIIRITDSSNASNPTESTAKIQNFAYDDLYRLTSVTTTNTANAQNYTRTYSYSPTGNITAFNGASYSYTDNGYNNPHAVTSVGLQNFSYDNNGNLTTDGTWTHSWNYNNMLASSTNGTDTVSYLYDVDKSRAKLTENTDVTYYPSNYYEVENGVVKVNILKDGKTIATKTVYPVGSPEYPTGGTDTEHIHTDHLGGTHIITDSSGTIVKTNDYYPFGAERVSAGSSNEDNGFTGYEHDVVTGLEYAEARYYNSDLGRFISQDPLILDERIYTKLHDPQQLNSYQYAKNNPLRYIDSSGEEVELVARPVFTKHDAHLFYVVTPDNPEEINIDGIPKGTKQFSVGAYNRGGFAGFGNKLTPEFGYENVSEEKRNTDYPYLTGEKDATSRATLTTPSGMTDTEFINQIGRAANGVEKQSYYSFGQQFYFNQSNSNNFVHHVGSEAGMAAQVESFNSTSGLYTPGGNESISNPSLAQDIKSLVGKLKAKIKSYKK